MKGDNFVFVKSVETKYISQALSTQVLGIRIRVPKCMRNYYATAGLVSSLVIVIHASRKSVFGRT